MQPTGIFARVPEKESKRCRVMGGFFSLFGPTNPEVISLHLNTPFFVKLPFCTCSWQMTNGGGL
jgi:hypothetical protein